MGILSMISGAANPYMLYIKIGIVVVLALLIGSLYWYGKHEADKVTDLTKQNGAQAQVIADESKTIDAYKSANQKWADALKKYQTDAQAQNDALASAEQQEERINARLKDLEARLRSDPHAAGQVVMMNLFRFIVRPNQNDFPA